jgi:hypothetical protein
MLVQIGWYLIVPIFAMTTIWQASGPERFQTHVENRIFGPYTWEECQSEKEYLDRLGHQMHECELLSIPQDAKRIEIGYLP